MRALAARRKTKGAQPSLTPSTRAASLTYDRRSTDARVLLFVVFCLPSRSSPEGKSQARRSRFLRARRKTSQTWTRSRLTDECMRTYTRLFEIIEFHYSTTLTPPPLLSCFTINRISSITTGAGRGTRHASNSQSRAEREREGEICSSSPRFHSYPMSFYVHYLTECLFRTSILPNTHLYTRSVLSFKEDLCVRNRRGGERERASA